MIFKSRVTLYVIMLYWTIFLHCEKEPSPLEPENIKFFAPNTLPALSLDNVGRFWDNDSIEHISEYVTAHFNRHPQLLASIRYGSTNGNFLAVSAFETPATAIAAMEERAVDVPALVFAGDSQDEEYKKYRDQYWSKDTTLKIHDKWWWSIYIFGAPQRGIFINKWNTIIKIGNHYDDLSDSTRLLLKDTAIEIAERVDALSE